MIPLTVLDDDTTGIVLYEGPSSYDQKPIVAIATLKTSNRKTGDLIQTWILRSDITPVEAVKTNEDSSICGTCIHRGSKGKNRSCYVNYGQAPLNIFDTYVNGGYRTGLSDDDLGCALAGRFLRLGSYGDPATLPYELCEKLVKFSIGNTGYSHMWRVCDQRFKNLLMASCDTETDWLDAHKLGWRTFRIREEKDVLMKGEFICPASEEGGKRLTCEQCLACAGTRSGKLGNRAGNVVIVVHGSPSKLSSYRKNMNSLGLLTRYGVLKKFEPVYGPPENTDSDDSEIREFDQLQSPGDSVHGVEGETVISPQDVLSRMGTDSTQETEASEPDPEFQSAI